MDERHAGDAEAEDGAAEAKARLREDLRAAMLAKAPLRVRVFRALIAALDDAEAVPPGDRHDRYVVHAFGDRSAEIPRLRLTGGEVRRVFEDEASRRRTAADELTALGKIDAAEILVVEAALIAAYEP